MLDQPRYISHRLLVSGQLSLLGVLRIDNGERAPDSYTLTNR